MADRPTLSPYALCEVEDVADLLGYDDEQTSLRQRTIIRSINSASSAIPKRAQREFVHTDAEKDQVRYVRIQDTDVVSGFARRRSGVVRIGDMMDVPSAVSLLSPDRDISYDFDVTEDTGDLFALPDVPEPGYPYEYLQIKAVSPIQPVEGYWLSVKADWGFPVVPNEIVEVAICTAASLILNDTQALVELARQAGRRISYSAIIPSEYLETVDSFRLYRVA